MIETLDVKAGSRVLEIGAGAGYATALLALLAGEVLSLERCQTLALEAAERLQAFGLTNVRVVWADGLDFDPGETRFDRILVHALIEAHAPDLTRALAPGGALVAAMFDETAGEQRIVRLARDAAGEITASARGPARTFAPLARGRALAL